MTKLYGAIEAGGTKFICAVGTSPDDIVAKVRVATTTPQETLSACLDFFKGHAPLAGIGISSFGPLDLAPTSPHFGSITRTPKPHWSGTNLINYFSTGLDVPIVLDTDVNGAALAESLWGAGKGLKNVVYFTIGTGIGAGVMVSGNLVHGLVHPELGHLIVRRDPRDTFEGVCPFHKDCLEGLASGPAIKGRWGIEAAALHTTPDALDIIGNYISQGIVAAILTASPEKVILGGGVLDQKELFPVVRRWTLKLLNGYVVAPVFETDLSDYITPSGLVNVPAGLAGAFALIMNR